jgi:uncharacterized protein (DUF2141 family)
MAQSISQNGVLNMKMTQTRLWMLTLAGGLTASLTAMLVSPASAAASSLTVNLSGVRSQKGNIVVCLWQTQAKNFPLCSKAAAFQSSTVKANGSSVAATFQNVPSGEYAITAFHDENQDGKLNRGMMGNPKEGIAISNVTFDKSRREKPSFDQAKFTVNGAKTMSLSFNYF